MYDSMFMVKDPKMLSKCYKKIPRKTSKRHELRESIENYLRTLKIVQKSWKSLGARTQSPLMCTKVLLFSPALSVSGRSALTATAAVFSRTPRKVEAVSCVPEITTWSLHDMFFPRHLRSLEVRVACTGTKDLRESISDLI